MAIPIQTRKKMLDAIERGEPVAAVARRFEVSETGLHKLRRTVRDRGTLEPAKTGPKGHVKLTDADVQLMREQVAANPGVTLMQLREMLSVEVAESTVCRALKKMGLSLKKKSLIAAEQLRPDVVERRHNFSIARRFVDPASLVFLDESGAQSNMTRRYGRAPIGQRCNDHTPHGHWKTTTLLSAIRLEGVIESATVIYDGPMNRPTFEGYVEQCLAPSLRPGDVVVMDNLSAHKSPAVATLIEAADATVWYLPPYSPDLNPIEKLWSKVKSWLRRVAARTFDAIGHALADVLRTVDPTECANYFQSCGYST